MAAGSDSQCGESTCRGAEAQRKISDGRDEESVILMSDSGYPGIPGNIDFGRELERMGHVYEVEELDAIRLAGMSLVMGPNGIVRTMDPQETRQWKRHISSLNRDRDSGNPLTIHEYRDLFTWTFYLHSEVSRMELMAVAELTALASKEQIGAYKRWHAAEVKRMKKAHRRTKKADRAGRATDEDRQHCLWLAPNQDEFARLSERLRFGTSSHKLWYLVYGNGSYLSESEDQYVTL